MRLSLSAALSPANLMSCSTTGAAGRGRPVAPQRVDRVAVDRDQGRRRRPRRSFSACSAFSVVCSHGSKPSFMPLLRFLSSQRSGGLSTRCSMAEGQRIDLHRRLHGVAAVGEQRGAVGEHDRRAGRAGEAGEPGEALLAGGQIFVLLAVGARHHETVEAALLQAGAQRRDAARRCARRRSNHRRFGNGPRTWPAL